MSNFTEILTSYVPTLVTRHLATDPTPPTEPAAESLPAAVLLADISGFTPLTERLAQRGPAGIEELILQTAHEPPVLGRCRPAFNVGEWPAVARKPVESVLLHAPVRIRIPAEPSSASPRPPCWSDRRRVSLPVETRELLNLSFPMA